MTVKRNLHDYSNIALVEGAVKNLIWNFRQFLNTFGFKCIQYILNWHCRYLLFHPTYNIMTNHLCSTQNISVHLNTCLSNQLEIQQYFCIYSLECTVTAFKQRILLQTLVAIICYGHLSREKWNGPFSHKAQMAEEVKVLTKP